VFVIATVSTRFQPPVPQLAYLAWVAQAPSNNKGDLSKLDPTPHEWFVLCFFLVSHKATGGWKKMWFRFFDGFPFDHFGGKRFWEKSSSEAAISRSSPVPLKTYNFEEYPFSTGHPASQQDLIVF
jgi:hypothetical protein